MKLIIDIPEDIRVAIGQMGLLRIPNEMQKKVDKAIQHGIPIPDNATNKEPCEDAVSRQAVLKCLGEYALCDDDIECDMDECQKQVVEHLIANISALPSVQPKRGADK